MTKAKAKEVKKVATKKVAPADLPEDEEKVLTKQEVKERYKETAGSLDKAKNVVPGGSVEIDPETEEGDDFPPTEEEIEEGPGNEELGYQVLNIRRGR